MICLRFITRPTAVQHSRQPRELRARYATAGQRNPGVERTSRLRFTSAQKTTRISQSFRNSATLDTPASASNSWITPRDEPYTSTCSLLSLEPTSLHEQIDRAFASAWAFLFLFNSRDRTSVKNYCETTTSFICIQTVFFFSATVYHSSR